jgi:hypothetical protein
MQIDGMTSRTLGGEKHQHLFSMPEIYELGQNFPNPFNPTTNIEFSLDEEAYVTLRVFNVLGQELAVILNREFLDTGEWMYTFDANSLSSGIYFYQLTVETLGDEEEGTPGTTFTSVKKMVLMR